MSNTTFVSVAALVLTLAYPAGAQKASGSFKLEPGTSFTPSVAAAFMVRDRLDPRQKRTEIVLSETPVDLTAALADLDPDGVVVDDPAVKGRDFVRFWIHADGTVSMNARLGAVQFVDQTAAPGHLKAEISASTPERVAGRIFTETAVKARNGSSYSVDLAFSAPVTRPPPGTALPAGGGDPGMALTAFLAAREKKEWTSLKAALSPALSEELVKAHNDDGENLSGALTTLDLWLPSKDVSITGGTLTGETAVLEVEGEMAYGTKALALARMVRAPAGWLFDRAKMVGMLP